MLELVKLLWPVLAILGVIGLLLFWPDKKEKKSVEPIKPVIEPIIKPAIKPAIKPVKKPAAKGGKKKLKK